ncbi:RsfA family transcriptional regulator [Anaerobacillus sp. MEB173]|uniref:RsfA family transcriptional regulator n=1 Tax=Anaerobacillus sp. MEB173 TaxID=3383345 RepID=UPI003F9128FC
MKVRQDAWSHEDDLLLAETVLRHIREGGTQLKAFDEVGDALNRTSAACGFRWNAVVRNRYEDAIKLAKKQRKELKRNMSYSAVTVPKQTNQFQSSYSEEPNVNPVNNSTMQIPEVITKSESTITMQDVIRFLQNLNNGQHSPQNLKKENEKLLKENLELLTKNKELETQLQQLEKDHSVIEEDYQSLIQIMNRARRMAILQEDEEFTPPKFRMDKNGNLEKLAK